MTITTPTLDPRTNEAIVDRTRQLLKRYADWQPHPGQPPDAGEALVGIFGRMMEQVIAQLNQAPERNFLAFLAMIGAHPLPPRPARTPLTFALATGVQEAAVTVPAGVQAAPASDPTVIFETEKDLTVHRAQLKALIVQEPAADRYADHTAVLTLAAPYSFPAFAGNKLIAHSLFLACDPYLAAPIRKTITLTFTSSAAATLRDLPLVWYAGGQEMKPQPTGALPDGQSWQVVIPALPAVARQTVAGVTQAWLAASVAQRLALNGQPPAITKLTAEIAIDEQEVPLTNLLAFADALPLDVTKQFHPFGEKPRRGATFYLAVPVAFTTGETTITMHFTFDPSAPIKPSTDLAIDWEAWGAQGWQPLTPTFVPSETTRFCANGSIKLTLPNPMEQHLVNGVSGHWLRARLVAGNFGEEAQQTIEITDGQVKKYQTSAATFAPPVVKTLTVQTAYHKADVPLICKTLNNFLFTDPQIKEDGQVIDKEGQAAAFAPFLPSAERLPALYLGFDAPLPNRLITLYWNVTPGVDQRGGQGAGFVPPQLEWQYAATDGWHLLPISGDETQNLTRPGLITFVGPPAMPLQHHFPSHVQQELAWLRVICKNATGATLPTVMRLLTNTTWASQAVTIHDEILGSGTGEAGQHCATTRFPLLGAPVIEVRELETSNASERASLSQAVGADAIRLTPTGEVWVRWQEMPDFYASGPHSRHYQCDHLTGQVRFGDGCYGMAPPRGRNNIRAVRYRTGGGVQGNRPAQTLTQLKTTIPFIDRVINHEPATGGAEAEPLLGVQERGPKLLRHRNRAITLADFADLAYEASPEVARAQALTVEKHDQTAETTPVTVVIVAQGDEARPTPTRALCADVAAYLRQRCAPAVQLNVCPPTWVAVTVDVTVVPETPQAANTLCTTVRNALQRFLHPLTGGFDQRGWAFGRCPHEADLYAMLETIPGVDHVRSLTRTLAAESEPLPTRSLICSGEHEVTVSM